MPDQTCGQILKRKALDRWENEGGRICAAAPGLTKSDSPGRRAGKENAVQISESPTPDDSMENAAGRC